MNDFKLASVIWICIAATVITLSIVGKGCNDSDNRVRMHGLAQGCDVTKDKNGNTEFTNCKVENK